MTLGLLGRQGPAEGSTLFQSSQRTVQRTKLYAIFAESHDDAKCSGLRFEISDLRFQMLDFRFEISDVRFEISDLRFQMLNVTFQISDFRIQIWDFRFEISDLRFQGNWAPEAGGTAGR